MASAGKNCLARVDTVVLAGGLATRLSAVLGDTPKVLAPIGGRPFLSYLLDWLRGFGARRVVLCLGHLAGVVEEFIDSAPRGGFQLVPVIEPQPLGTAGALRHARAKLQSDPVMVLNGDSFVDADLCLFLESYAASGAEASMLCASVDDAMRYGRVELAPDGRIKGFVEKNRRYTGAALVNAGAYLLSAALLDRIAAGTASSLERDVFETLPEGTVHAMAGRFTFIDIGTPESLARASEVLPRLTAPAFAKPAMAGGGR